MKHSSNSGFAAVFIILIVLLIGGVGAYIYFKQPANIVPVIQKTGDKKTVDTSDWKTYKNTETGFSFKYPSSVVFDNEADKDNLNQSELLVSAERLSDIPEDMPAFMGRNDAISQKELLAKGGVEDSVKIGSLYGSVSTRLSQFEVCSVILSRTLTFYPNDYRVIITLAGPKEAIMDSMPEFFTVDEKNCGSNRMWNQDNKSLFTNTLEKGEGKGAAKEWYDTFDEIVKTVTLITPTPTVKPTPVPTSSIPAGWKTYKNDQYGFEISYPDSYKAQSSKEDLYGYPKGVLLLYSGGQAYDVVIEVWNSEKEYQDEYQARVSDLTVFKSGEKFITLLDNTGSTNNKEVIKTFKLNK